MKHTLKYIALLAVLLISSMLFADDVIMNGNTNNSPSEMQGEIKYCRPYVFDGTYWDLQLGTSGSMHVLPNSNLIEDTAFTAAHYVDMMGCQFDDTTPNTLDEGDGGAPRCSTKRDVYVTLRDPTNERGATVTAANDVEVDHVTLVGTAVNVTSGNRDAGTQVVTLADDDDAVISLAVIDDWDEVHDVAVGTDGPLNICESRDFDGAAISTAVDTEGDAVRQGASLFGITYFMPVSEDGSETPMAPHDTAISAANGGSLGLMPVCESKNFDGSVLPNVVDTEGDAVRPAASLYGVTYHTLVSETGAETPIVAHDAAIGAATGGSSGLMPMCESKDFDGSALPNVVDTEGDAARTASSLYGVQYVMMVTEDGSAIGTILTSSELVDDAAFTPGTSYVGMAGFEFDDTTPDSVDEGDGGAARMSANRNIYMTMRDAAGNERGANITAGNAMEIDIAEQSLTAVAISATSAANVVTNPIFSQVSATAAANLVTNPIWIQISQDGTSAMDATHPLSISKDLAVNATGNRIWVTANMDMVAGTATNVNGGNRDAGTQTVTLADDDPATVSLAVIDDWDGIHDTAIGSDGATQMCESKDWDGAALPNVVDTEGDAVRASASLYGVQYVTLVNEDGSLGDVLVTAGAAGAANTDDGLLTYSRLAGYNGATWDPLLIDANDYLQVVDSSIRAGEDSGNDWRKAAIKNIDPTTTTETEGADTIAGAAIDIFDAVDVSGLSNWCLYIKNTDAADAFTDLDILTNFEDANWDDAVELVQTVCPDNLAADTMCFYCNGDIAAKYIKVVATGQVNPNESSSSVTLVTNKG